jgi:hypothetical protein
MTKFNVRNINYAYSVIFFSSFSSLNFHSSLIFFLMRKMLPGTSMRQVPKKVFFVPHHLFQKLLLQCNGVIIALPAPADALNFSPNIGATGRRNSVKVK